MIIDLRPPNAAGPLRIGAPGPEAMDVLRQLGVPVFLCRNEGGKTGWGVFRESGLFVGVSFDAQGRVGAIELGHPDDGDDAVIYNGLDVFTTPAADLVTRLRSQTTLEEEELEDGYCFTAPDLLLSFWQYPSDDSDELDGVYFTSVRVGEDDD
jgi:hypothetical protein